MRNSRSFENNGKYYEKKITSFLLLQLFLISLLLPFSVQAELPANNAYVIPTPYQFRVYTIFPYEDGFII